MSGGYAATLPRATPEQVLAAVSALETDGPVTIGRIAQQVAGHLGIDMRWVEGAYDLRRLISWGGLQTEIKHLVHEGKLVRYTEENWNRLTRGMLFPGKASPTTWAYCTAVGAQAVRELAQGHGSRMRSALAAQYAMRALADRYPGEYAALAAQWLRDHPVTEEET